MEIAAAIIGNGSSKHEEPAIDIGEEVCAKMLDPAKKDMKEGMDPQENDDHIYIDQQFKIEPEVIISHENEENVPQGEGDNRNSRVQNGVNQRHFNQVPSNWKYSCECGRYFRTQAEMETHLCVYVSSNTAATTANSDKEEGRVFSCVDCGKTFMRRNHLQRHEVTHSGVRSHVCQHCGAGFFRSEHLSRHMNTHAQLKLHECFLCNKRLTRPEHLLRHLKIHDRDGCRPCYVCGEVLPSSKVLNDHIQENHR